MMTQLGRSEPNRDWPLLGRHPPPRRGGWPRWPRTTTHRADVRSSKKSSGGYMVLRRLATRNGWGRAHCHLGVTPTLQPRR